MRLTLAGAVGGTSGPRLLAALVADPVGACRPGLRAAGPWPAATGRRPPAAVVGICAPWACSSWACRRFRKPTRARRAGPAGCDDARPPHRRPARHPGHRHRRPRLAGRLAGAPDRMAARAAAGPPGRSPTCGCPRAIRFSLRYVALTAFVMALLFGSFWRVRLRRGPYPRRSRRDAAAAPAGRAGPSRPPIPASRRST